MKFRFVKIAFFGIIAFAAFIAVVMLLWNAIVPGIFTLPVITFWQAAGLLVLARILFGGFHCRHHHSMHGGWHNNKLRAKWKNMTEEERKEFIQNRRKYWSEMNREGHRNFMHHRHGMCCDDDVLFKENGSTEKGEDQGQKHE
jgi:hypothetical protein